mmetsp:Transcript_15860/g.34219  ORF Transcript_15860/g.34219 Transcript_15860/m.34219 type:complete len:241 (+) Transcript_15860:99-821(+)
MAGFFSRHKNVLLYVPNLIGYVRVGCALYSFAVALHSPVQCILFYFFSFVCDELDGRFARMLNQTSTLGAVLDMVTDRLATTGLLLVLAVLYPKFHFIPVCLIFLDIFSHWFQMYSTLLLGAATHKDVRSKSWLVRKYYQHRIFMGFCCVCCEVLYLVIYAMYFPELQQYRWKEAVIVLPTFFTNAVPGLASVFSPAGLPWLAVLGIIAVPGVMIKQLCNWVQLQNAADSLVGYEVKRIK